MYRPIGGRFARTKPSLRLLPTLHSHWWLGSANAAKKENSDTGVLTGRTFRLITLDLETSRNCFNFIVLWNGKAVTQMPLCVYSRVQAWDKLLLSPMQLEEVNCKMVKKVRHDGTLSGLYGSGFLGPLLENMPYPFALEGPFQRWPPHG